MGKIFRVPFKPGSQAFWAFGGALMNKGLTLKTGQTHMQRYMKPLLKKIEDRQIDPSFVITHRIPLAEAPEAYKTFRDKKDGCIKVVIKP